MKTGKCPKCGSTEIYIAAKRYPEPRGVVGVTLWSSVAVDDYICSSCGFIETYLHDMDSIQKISRSGTKVNVD